MTKMNVPDFLDSFIVGEMNVEVHILTGRDNYFIYVGSPTNSDAFKRHMKAFKDTVVCFVCAEDGKLIIHARMKGVGFNEADV